LYKIVVRPYSGQLYNLFHACDPNASRIEPLIQSEFSQIPPCCIPRYSQFPLGDGESTLLGKKKESFKSSIEIGFS
jgi:hypothetical protein